MSENPPDDSAPHVTLCGGTRLTRRLRADAPLTIGQSRSAALRIPHPALGEIHCTVTLENGLAVLRDGGSPAGTKVNGWPVDGAGVLLNDGDEITAGIFQLLFSWKAPAPPAPPPPPPPPPVPPAAVTVETPAQAPASPVTDFAPWNPPPTEYQTEPPRTPDSPPVEPPSAGALTVSFRGRAAGAVPLFSGLTFGSGPQADVKLQDPSLSAVQAVIEAGPDGFTVVDQGRTGSLVNGKFFERHPLIIGDLLQLGERHFFFFDGFALRPVRDGLGCGIQAWGIDVTGGGRRGLILRGAGVDVRPGQFAGIIGPSGAGKTTLLRALLGFRSVSAGTILIDGQNLRDIRDPSRYFGYVPQQEIVHLELTARQALRYSALLRLPAKTPRREMEKLIHALTTRLGLEQHLDTRAGRLSGGQLKRLSVCVELLSRPPLLFLDEPTSGLDPESEMELMQQLQELSYTGCTVVCTTHLMENVYLMSSLEVVMAGRDGEGRPTPGRTVFRGKPTLARELFGVRSLSKLYAKLKERAPEEWQRLYQEKTGNSLTDPPEHSCAPRTEPSGRRERRRAAVPVLLARQWQILKSDWKNLLLLLGQPLLIATLIALVATGDDPSDKKLFLASIAILWLGCGNAAPELVRERSIFRREQFTGLRASSYLLSKFLALGVLTGIQALLIFGILKFASGGLDGSAPWQLGGFLMTAAAATGLGLAVSAWARTTLQAVLLVPVIIIPQILFAGFVFPAKDWENHAVPRVASRVFPSFATQRVMDVSLLWNKPVEEASTYLTALNNLTTSLRPLPLLFKPDQPMTVALDESRIYAPPPEGQEPFTIREFEWNPGKRNVLTPRYLVPTMRDERPRVFRHAAPAWTGIFSLLAWTVATGTAALILLWRKDKE